MVRVPGSAAAEARVLGLGRFERRYRRRLGTLPYLGVVALATGPLCFLARVPLPIAAVLLVIGAALSLYTAMSSLNAGCFLYERGFVQVGPTGKVRFAAQWSDIDVAGSSYGISHKAPAEPFWYAAIHKNGRRAEFSVENLRGAAELFDILESRRRNA